MVAVRTLARRDKAGPGDQFCMALCSLCGCRGQLFWWTVGLPVRGHEQDQLVCSGCRRHAEKVPVTIR